MSNSNGSSRARLRASWGRPVATVVAASMLMLMGVGAASAQETTDVQVGGDQDRFTPENVTVEEGDTVTFTWAGGTHNVTFDDGVESETTADQGTNFERTFDDEGTFDYRCTIHGNVMTGSVTVAAAADPEPAEEPEAPAEEAPEAEEEEAPAADEVDDTVAEDADEEMDQPDRIDAGQGGLADQGLPMVVGLMALGLFALAIPAVALARRRR